MRARGVYSTGRLVQRLRTPENRYTESAMREDQIQLVAFRNAELDSEHLRIFGVIDFFAIFMLITVVRAFVIRTASGTTSWRSLILTLVVIGYELWMLSKVQCALQAKAMFSSRGSFPRTERQCAPLRHSPFFPLRTFGTGAASFG